MALANSCFPWFFEKFQKNFLGISQRSVLNFSSNWWKCIDFCSRFDHKIVPKAELKKIKSNIYPILIEKCILDFTLLDNFLNKIHFLSQFHKKYLHFDQIGIKRIWAVVASLNVCSSWTNYDSIKIYFCRLWTANHTHTTRNVCYTSIQSKFACFIVLYFLYAHWLCGCCWRRFSILQFSESSTNTLFSSILNSRT